MAVKTEVRTARGRFLVALFAIAAVGLLWRIIYTIWMQDLPIKSDGVHYSFAAGLLADGNGFINPLATFADGSPIPDATHPPGWTLVLGAVTFLGFRSVLAYQFTAALVGTATIVMIGLAARAAFDRRIGLIAAGLAAVYPGIWLYERELVSEPMGLLVAATLIWLAYRFRTKPGIGAAIVLGLVLGVAALTRSEMILLAALIVAPVILSAWSVPLARRVGWLAAAGLATVLVIAPWFAYNTTRFEQPVPLSVGLGATMQSGNCGPTYEDGDLLGYYQFGCVVFVPNLSADPSVADGQYRASALEFMKNHKKGFVKVAAVRVGRTFSVYAPFQQTEYESERGTTMWVLTLARWSYWLLVPFAVAGFVIARRRKVPVYPLLAFVVVTLLAVVFTIGAVRYRSTVEIGIVILAATAIDALVRRWAPGRDATEPPARDEPKPAALATVGPTP